MRIPNRLRACVLSAAILAASFGQPARAADLPHGVFGFITAKYAFPDGLYSDPSMTGVTLITSWSDLEPQQYHYNWSYLDAQIALAVQNGRQVAIRVQPDVYVPKWLFTAGAAKFSFRWYLGSGFPQCSTVSFPLPWDPVYLNNWTRLITSLGARYAANPAVTLIKLDGVNSITGETLLVYSAGDHNPGAGICGAAQIAPVSSWKSAGYLPSKVTSAWNRIMSTYVASFPTQQLAIETGSWGFPPIDEAGKVIAGSDGDMNEIKTLDQIGAQIAGSRFVLQNDGLSTAYTYPRPSTVPATTPQGYEPTTRITNDTSCRDNGGATPCDPATVTAQMMANARAAGAEYVEMFVDDLQNPALSAAIASFAN